MAFNSMSLLSPLNRWLEDSSVRDIMMNKGEVVYVDSDEGMAKHSVPDMTSVAIHAATRFIATENKQYFDSGHPILSATLLDNSRIQAVLPPISLEPCFAIRKINSAYYSFEELMSDQLYQAKSGDEEDVFGPRDDLMHQLLINQQWTEFIKAALRKRLSILISGETGSGKTTLLKTIISHLLTDERVICLEDIRELVFTHGNFLSLLTREAHPECHVIDLSELLRIALRLRPDRIILGELRGPEALHFINAIQTGHGGSIATIHAGSPEQARDRLVTLCSMNEDVPPFHWLQKSAQKSVDVVIQLERSYGQLAISAIDYRGETRFTSF